MQAYFRDVRERSQFHIGLTFWDAEEVQSDAKENPWPSWCNGRETLAWNLKIDRRA